MGLCCGIDRENTFDAELQAFVAGPIANRLSEDRALLLGMALYSICFIGFALASSVWAFCLFFIPVVRKYSMPQPGRRS